MYNFISKREYSNNKTITARLRFFINWQKTVYLPSLAYLCVCVCVCFDAQTYFFKSSFSQPWPPLTPETKRGWRVLFLQLVP